MAQRLRTRTALAEDLWTASNSSWLPAMPDPEDLMPAASSSSCTHVHTAAHRIKIKSRKKSLTVGKLRKREVINYVVLEK